MLNASKFVNTKAYQKTLDKNSPLSFPLLSANEVPAMKTGKQFAEQQPVPVRMPVADECKVDKSKIHASVNLDEMLRLEDLRKQDDDWMAFFAGSPAAYEPSLLAEFGTEPQQTEACSLILASSFRTLSTEEQEPVAQEEEPRCLDKIFDEMGSEFKLAL